MKKIIALLCTCAMVMLLVIPFPLSFAAVTREAKSWDDAATLAPGSMDNVDGASNGIPRSDYSVIGGEFNVIDLPTKAWISNCPNIQIVWGDGSNVKTNVSKVYVPSPWVPGKSLAYKVQAGSYVTIPVGLARHSFLGANDGFTHSNIFTFEVSEDATTWTTATDLTTMMYKSEGKKEIKGYTEIQFATIHMGQAEQYVRVSINHANLKSSLGISGDTYNNALWSQGAIYVISPRAHASAPEISVMRIGNSVADAKVLGAGCIDDLSGSPGGFPLSSYGTISGSTNAKDIKKDGWLAGNPEIIWDDIKIERVYGTSPFANENILTYIVNPGEYVVVPLGLATHSILNPTENFNFSLFTIEISSDNATWSAPENITSTVETVAQTKIQWNTIKVGEGQKYIRVRIPNKAEMNAVIGMVLNDDNVWNACPAYVIPARAYDKAPGDAVAATQVDEMIEALGEITLDKEADVIAAREAYNNLTEAQKTLVTELETLEQAEAALIALEEQDKVIFEEKEFEDAVIEGKYGGYKPRLVDLHGDYAVVRVVDGGTVTLQQVADGLKTKNVTLEFYRGSQKLALTEKASNGIVLKAIQDDDTVYAEKTIQIYNHKTPTESSQKKVLKPGIMDIMIVGNNDHNPVSDYAKPLGETKGLTIASNLDWLTANHRTPNKGILWGQATDTLYGVWWSTSNVGVEYRVLPNSYIGVPLIYRGEYDENTKTKSFYDKLSFKVSKDGVDWENIEVIDTEAINTFKTSYEAIRTLYFVCHIPEDYYYIRINLPDDIYKSGNFIGGGEWLQYGYGLGMAKASWTPITKDNNGDVLRGWYEDSSISSKDAVKLTFDNSIAKVRKESASTMTLADVKALINVNFAEVKFLTSGGTEITDLNTSAADGQIIRAISKGNETMADGEIVAEYTIEITVVDEIVSPGITTESDKVEIDEDANTITFTFYSSEPESYADLLALLKAEYCELRLVDGNGTLFENENADVDGGVYLQLVAKDCPGLEDGIVTATYEIIPNAVIKEVSFSSKNTNKVKINEASKIIKIVEGITLGELLDSLDVVNCEIRVYDEDINEITDRSTILTKGMGLELELDVTTIWYDFEVMEASTEVPDTGDALTIFVLSQLSLSAIGISIYKRRKK